MSTDEREQRSSLAETAALAGPPRFTSQGLAAQVRRTRRRRLTSAGMAAFGVAAVAAAVAVPLTAGGSRGVPSVAPTVSLHTTRYVITVNGRTPPDQTRYLSLLTIRPGEKVTITVTVTVPRPVAMKALWLGIVNGVEGSPADMKPVLAASHGPLRPGVHRFVLHWTVPAGLAPGATRQLADTQAWARPVQEETSGEVADFAVPVPPASPASAMRKLRAVAVQGLRFCDASGPTWIRAVRTTYGKAMDLPDLGPGDNIYAGAADPVYLVLMKGAFFFFTGTGRAPSCDHTLVQHYSAAVFDATTFVTLEQGWSNRPFRVPLRELGRVLNLGPAN